MGNSNSCCAYSSSRSRRHHGESGGGGGKRTRRSNNGHVRGGLDVPYGPASSSLSGGSAGGASPSNHPGGGGLGHEDGQLGVGGGVKRREESVGNLQHISEREPDDWEEDPSLHPTTNTIFMEKSKQSIQSKTLEVAHWLEWGELGDGIKYGLIWE